MDGYFQWIFGFNFFGFQSPSIRVTGVFRDEEILGHFGTCRTAFNFLARIFLWY